MSLHTCFAVCSWCSNYKGGGAQHNYAHQHQIDLEQAWPGKTAQKTVVRIVFCLLQKTLKGFDIFCCCCIFLHKRKISWLCYTFVFQSVFYFFFVFIKCSSKNNCFVTTFVIASFIIIISLLKISENLL